MTHKEITIAKPGDLKDGEMRQVSAGGTDILLVRVGGKYHAVGAHCTHYGALLAEGALCGERVVCPWHHACFNVATGDLEEPPALDALPRSEVRVEAATKTITFKGGDTLACDSLLVMPSPARLRNGPVNFLGLLSDGGAGDSLSRDADAVTV